MVEMEWEEEGAGMMEEGQETEPSDVQKLGMKKMEVFVHSTGCIVGRDS